MVGKPTIVGCSSSAKRSVRAQIASHPTPRHGDNDERTQRRALLLEAARNIESLSGQVRALAEAGGRASERVGGPEQKARQIQEGPERAAQQNAMSPSRLRRRGPGRTHQQDGFQTVEPSLQVGGAKGKRFHVLLEPASRRISILNKFVTCRVCVSSTYSPSRTFQYDVARQALQTLMVALPRSA